MFNLLRQVTSLFVEFLVLMGVMLIYLAVKYSTRSRQLISRLISLK